MASKLIGKISIFWTPPPRHVRRKISASVDGGPSGGSRVRRPGSEDPHRRQRNFFFLLGPPLFKTTEGVVVGFQIFACAPKNSGKKIKCRPSGGDFQVFQFYRKLCRLLCRHLCRKISASVDGGLSGGSSVCRPGSEGPHRRQQNLFPNFSIRSSWNL